MFDSDQISFVSFERNQGFLYNQTINDGRDQYEQKDLWLYSRVVQRAK